MAWEETDTVVENYQANKFVCDPNEGFGRNQRRQPLKSKQDREAEDGETFSDDDGEPHQGEGTCTSTGAHMVAGPVLSSTTSAKGHA